MRALLELLFLPFAFNYWQSSEDRSVFSCGFTLRVSLLHPSPKSCLQLKKPFHPPKMSNLCVLLLACSVNMVCTIYSRKLEVQFRKSEQPQLYNPN